MLSRSNHLNVLRYCPKINFWWTYDIFTRKIRSSRSFKDQNAWFLLIFPLFLDILTFIWPWLFYLDILYIFLSLADDLSVILYQNNEVTSTSNPTIHIHIKKPFENSWFVFLHFHFSKVIISSLRWALIIKLPMQDVLNLLKLFRIRF